MLKSRAVYYSAFNILRLLAARFNRNIVRTHRYPPFPDLLSTSSR